MSSMTMTNDDDGVLLVQGIAVALLVVVALPIVIWLRDLIAGKKEEDLTQYLPTEEECETLHLMVLVHGLQNSPWSLQALTAALKEQAKSVQKKGEAVVVYPSSSTVGLTTTGILECGQKVAEEINDLMEEILKMKQPPSRITLSMYGNSLGGLMTRAALPGIQWTKQQQNGVTVTIEPHVFCSTNSPHLGSRGTLIFPVPAWFQYTVSVLYGKSMMDLFRYTDSMDQLQSPAFLKILGDFTKRVAYSTSHQTDFQVPTATAAFLSKGNDSPHQTLPDYAKEDPFVLHALTTPKTSKPSTLDTPDSELSDEEWIAHHSALLDALGWTKIFCDVRSCLPGIPYSFLVKTKTTSLDDNSSDKKDWTSAQLHQVYCTGTPGKWYAPLAHTIYTGMLAGFKWNHQTVVDDLAERMLVDVLES